MARALYAAVIIWAGLFAAGCAQLRGQLLLVSQTHDANRLSEEELRFELASFARRFELILGVTLDRIAEATGDWRTRRAGLEFRLAVVPLIEDAVRDPDPQRGYVASLTLVVMLRRYLTEGEGRDLFAAEQATVVAMLEEVEEGLYELGEAFLRAEELQRLRAEVEEFARARPIRGRERGLAIETLGRALEDVERSTRFDWVMQLPMSPFRALQGVGSTPEAVRDFTVAARDFARIAEGLPQQLRWQLQLLYYEALDVESVATLVAAFDGLSESTQRIARSVEALPTDAATLLEQSRDSLAQLDRTLASAQQVVTPLAQTAASLESASSAWTGLLQARRDAPLQRAPFNINDWAAAARDVGHAAIELRALGAELGLLLEPGAPRDLGGVAQALRLADARARGLVDLVAWRSLQLAGAVFCLALLYRWLAPRLASRNAG